MAHTGSPRYLLGRLKQEDDLSLWAQDQSEQHSKNTCLKKLKKLWVSKTRKTLNVYKSVESEIPLASWEAQLGTSFRQVDTRHPTLLLASESNQCAQQNLHLARPNPALRHENKVQASRPWGPNPNWAAFILPISECLCCFTWRSLWLQLQESVP